MPLETKLTKLLNIRVPVVQGGMQWYVTSLLSILTALTQPSPEALRHAIRETRKMTKYPFGVNITLLPSINPPDYEGYARAAVEEGVKVFETAGNNPGPLIKFFKSHGCIVIHKCTTIRHAKSAERLGVDCLSIDGFECAGHPGEEDIGGIVLLARAAQELKVPYIASGGFADGRGLASALALGACGVNMGTRFMCTVESPIHQNIKDKIIASTERDTVHIFRTLHNTARVFKNAISEQVVALERRPGGANAGRLVYVNGDPDYGIWTAGIVMGLIKDCPTCEDLLRTIEKEAEEVIGELQTFRVTAKAKLLEWWHAHPSARMSDVIMQPESEQRIVMYPAVARRDLDRPATTSPPFRLCAARQHQAMQKPGCGMPHWHPSDFLFFLSSCKPAQTGGQ
ncbi:hypothetical protein ONZ51_g12550 [Trametes cubensis]|uniref:Nitronate monooxygenase domain-containing protein n=1 Tax=Trametes cubensis TaxID=1111947 RepID=A0AAD7TFJ6_9APHY|nr:hypothetical protein ONZ51_g12550 [Trametes cubensis]